MRDNKYDSQIKNWLSKFSDKWDFQKNKEDLHKNTTKLAQTEEEQRRLMVGDSYVGKRTIHSFYNLAHYKSLKDLINQYRQLEYIPEVSEGVSQIVDECVSLTAENPVKLDLSRNKYIHISKDLEIKLHNEFEKILQLLDFFNTADDLFRQFVYDGRLYFENVFDPTNIKAGIIGLTLLNPKVIDYFFDQNEKIYFPYIPFIETGEYETHYNQNQTSVLYTEENITWTHSGIWDPEREIILGWLHPSLKEALRLSLLEDAATVYRLVRAPERRVYEVDVGKMPAKQAEEYVQKMMSEFRARKVYDPETGQLIANQSYMNMMEDIWLPKTSDGRGTTVTSLEGGQNLGEIEDIEYFQKKLFKSMKVPRRRLDPESSYTYVSDSEINYEEYQFLKYVQKIRKRFSYIFVDLLRKQCILKGLLTVENFNKLNLNFVWETDSKFDEVNSIQMLGKRVSMLDALGEYIGKYFSNGWVRKQVLGMTERDSEIMDQEIAFERQEMEKTGIDPDEPTSAGLFASKKHNLTLSKILEKIDALEKKNVRPHR
jgi:hypothetical protein